MKVDISSAIIADTDFEGKDNIHLVFTFSTQGNIMNYLDILTAEIESLQQAPSLLPWIPVLANKLQKSGINSHIRVTGHTCKRALMKFALRGYNHLYKRWGEQEYLEFFGATTNE